RLGMSAAVQQLRDSASIVERDDVWIATWRDCVGRLVVRRLGDAKKMDRDQAGVAAYEVAEKHALRYQRQMKLRSDLSEEELDELRETASFPRQVVDKYIKRILPTLETGDKGVTRFLEMTGIAQKE